MRIEHELRSDTGRRANNEDSVIAAPELGLFAVADGMGGYEGGEVASRLALESLRDYFERLGPDGIDLENDRDAACQQVRMAIRIADRAVRRQAHGVLAQMGTTLCVMVARGERAILAHVGDSRIYRLREGELHALTRDHSLCAEMEAAGLAVSTHLYHVITQALGQGPDTHPDLRVIEVLRGDRFLLCSDGLSDVMRERDLVDGLQRTSGAADTLVETAFALGSLDNITALVVRVD